MSGKLKIFIAIIVCKKLFSEGQAKSRLKTEFSKQKRKILYKYLIFSDTYYHPCNLFLSIWNVDCLNCVSFIQKELEAKATFILLEISM